MKLPSLGLTELGSNLIILKSKNMLRFRIVLIGIIISLTACAEVQKSQKLKVDTDGTLHVPAFKMPPSQLLSEDSRNILGLRGMVPWAWMGDCAPKSSEHKSYQERVDLMRNCMDKKNAITFEKVRAIHDVNIIQEDRAGVNTYTITPSEGITTANQHRVLLYFPASGFTENTNIKAQSGAAPLTALGKIKVIGVDYRKSYEYAYPAAQNDAVSVYRTLLKDYKPENIGIYGCSAGGALTGQTVPWFEKAGLPQAGALVMTGAAASRYAFGDSMYLTHGLSGKIAPEFNQTLVDVHPYYKGVAGTDEAAFPAVSADVLKQFPPSLLISSSRDYSLSSVIHTHSQLVKQGVEANLHVWEGLPHCFQNKYPSMKESREAFDVIWKFFDKHLGND